MTGFFAVWAEGVLLTGSMWGFSATPAPGGAFASFLGMSNSLAFVASHGFGYVGGHLDVFYPTACLYHVWAFWGVEGQHPRVRVQYFVVFFYCHSVGVYDVGYFFNNLLNCAVLEMRAFDDSFGGVKF